MTVSKRLTAETVQSAALALERVHHIHGSNRFAAGMLGVGLHKTQPSVLLCAMDQGRLMIVQ